MLSGTQSSPPARPEHAAGRPAARDSHVRRSLEFVTLAWVFGAVWQTAIGGSPTTQFLKGLGASNFQFGLFAALPFVASLISLPASLWVERTGRRKGIFLWTLYLQRLLWVPLALVPLWMITAGGAAAGWTAGAALAVFLGLTFVMHAAGSAGGPAWVSWMADTVPERVRGKFFSRRRQWGILTAIPTALLVGWMLDSRLITGGDSWVVLRWCAIIFACSAVFGAVDIVMFQFVPEEPRPPKTGPGLLRALGEPLKDRRFLLFGGLVAMLTFAVTFLNQFATLYLRDHVYVGGRAGSFNTGAQLMMLVGPMAAQLLVLPLWGAAADRVGKKPLLAIAGLGLVPVGLAWCLLGPGNVWLGYLLAALGAALWTGVEIANFNLVLEMSAGGDGSKGAAGGGGSSYVAVNTVIVNVAGCLGGLTAGLIAEALRDWHWTPFAGWKTATFYDVLFVLSGVLRLAAVAVFLPFIHEPTARSAAAALRFMAGHVCNSVTSAVVRPVTYARRRWVRPAVEEPWPHPVRIAAHFPTHDPAAAETEPPPNITRRRAA